MKNEFAVDVGYGMVKGLSADSQLDFLSVVGLGAKYIASLPLEWI